MLLSAALLFAAFPQISLANIQSENSEEVAAAPFVDGVYRVQQELEIYPNAIFHHGQPVPNAEGVTFDFNPGHAFSLAIDGELAILTFAGPTFDESGEFTQIVLEARDLPMAVLDYIWTADVEHELVNDLGKDEYAARRGVRRKSRPRLRIGGNTGCVAYVKRATGINIVFNNGRGATTALRGIGWRSTSCSKPPKGAVASWTGGKHGKGHTAIWTGRCWAYDLGCTDNTLTGYRLKDCVVRGARKRK